MQIEIDGDGDTIVMLAHGAGANKDGKTLLRIRDSLVERGLKVARFNFLYKEEGRSFPDRMPQLIERYAEATEQVRGEAKRLILSGHSMGGRTASMMAAEGFAMDGLVCFAYPLHPVGQPGKLRDEHLPRIVVPAIFINGTNDEFCTKALMEEIVPRLEPTFRMQWIEGADHGLTVKKRETGRSNAEVMQEIGETLQGWLGGALPQG